MKTIAHVTLSVATIVVGYLSIASTALGGVCTDDNRSVCFRAGSGSTGSPADVRAVSIQGLNTDDLPVESVLGPIKKSTMVAALPSNSDADGLHGTTYLSRRYHFQLSWPDNLQWASDEALGKEMLRQMRISADADVPIIVSWKDRIAGIMPSVNVVTMPVNNMAFQHYMDVSVSQLNESGWHVHSVDIDQESQGGVVVSTVYGFSQVQRFALNSGRVYVVTATMPTTDVLPAQVKDGLLSIVNSFTLLKP